MKLKERFTKFVAYECKTSAISKFIEYWVPVRLSDLQVEQYCACLLSNSHLLCSTLKSTDSFSTLHDILMATRKCCDHPYLVDWTLGRSIVKGLPVDAHLDVEIELSGKLQLLSRILIEVRKRGLRVLILFQALPASGQISVGDILDDFIHQKFGKDCHARICVNVSPPMRRSILNKFNSKESGKFVLLMETRACSPSTKLSDIDSVILFNSDWDPANDFRALQKVSIDSKFEHLSIFRLYSSCTIEEKILILAKRGLTIDSKINRIKQATCHELLAWGALYLFRRSSSSSNSNVTQYFNTLLDDVFSELLNLLPGGSGNAAADNSCCLRISRVEPAVDGGAYAQQNISLPVELETQLMEDSSFLEGLIGEGHTSLFWMNLFQGKGLFLSIPSSRTRNRQPWSLNNGLEKDDSDDSETTHQEFDEEGINDDVGSRETMGNNQPLAAVFSVQQSAGNVPLTDTTVSRNTKDLGRIHTPLHSEMNKIQVERESTMKLHEELKLLLKSEFEKELREIRKKYDLLLENVEMEIAKKQEEFDACFARVYVSKLLAEFMVEKVNNVVDCTTNFQPMEKVSSGKSVFSKGTYQLCSQQMSSYKENQQESNAIAALPGEALLGSQVDSDAPSRSQVMRTWRPPPTRGNGPLFLPVTLQVGGVPDPSSVAAHQTRPFSCLSFSGNLEARFEIRVPPPHLRRLIR
ncbi:unnamed protein product [Cuscuta epithymum]|nr:unnamed protein product [Cuscuta epithymum]